MWRNRPGPARLKLCLREAGGATLWVGRATPVAEVVALVRRGAVRLVALSASCVSTDALALRRQARQVAEACRASGAWLALGGAGAWPDALRDAQRFRSLPAFAARAREAAGRSRPESA